MGYFVAYFYQCIGTYHLSLKSHLVCRTDKGVLVGNVVCERMLRDPDEVLYPRIGVAASHSHDILVTNGMHCWVYLFNAYDPLVRDHGCSCGETDGGWNCWDTEFHQSAEERH